MSWQRRRRCVSVCVRVCLCVYCALEGVCLCVYCALALGGREDEDQSGGRVWEVGGWGFLQRVLMFIVVGVGALAGMVTRTVLSSMGCCLAWRLNNPDSDLDDADLFVAVTAGGEHDQQGDLQARTRQPQEPGLLPTLSSYAHPAFWVCPLRYPPTHTLCCAVVRSARYTILVRSLGLYNTLSSDAHPVQCAVLRKRMVAAHHFRHGAQAREGNGAYEPGQLTLLCPKHERFQLNRAQISPQTSKFLDQLCLGAESWWLTWRGYDLKPALGDSEMSVLIRGHVGTRTQRRRGWKRSWRRPSTSSRRR